MKTRILITGATGFVGRQVIKALRADRTQLRLVVREGKEEEVRAFRSDAEVVSSKDIFSESSAWWKQQCTSVDLVVHLAWYAEPGMYLESSRNFDCLTGSLDLAKGAIDAGVKRLVGIGSCFEYDLNAAVLSVETPLKPLTPYAAAKAALYMILDQMLTKGGTEFVWCRLFYLFGEGEDPRRLVPYLRSKIEKNEQAELTSGTQIRDFLNVADAGRTIAEVALGSQVGPVNICSGMPITVRQLAEAIADEFGRRDLLCFGARPMNLVDPQCVLGIPNIQFKGAAN
jgi:nucleoside-diphosphate-sugar epimerase